MQIILKLRPAPGRERIACLRPVLHFFGVRHQAQTVKGAQMRDEVAVTHSQFLFEVLKRPAHTGSQQSHDREPPFFVDRLVELVEVQHCSFEDGLGSFTWALPWPRAGGVDEMKDAERHPHRHQGQIDGEIINQIC